MADVRQPVLDRARNGDAEALSDLLGQFRPYVRVLVQATRPGSMPARVDDSDMIQDSLLLAHRAFQKFRGTTVAEFAGWLRQLTIRTVGHTARSQLDAGKRTAHRELAIEDLDGVAVADGSAPDSRALRHEQAAQVAAAVDQLPDDMRQIILGRFLHGMPYEELARKMGKNEGAVRVMYTRALRKLREIMEN